MYLEYAQKIGYPVVLRPAYTLGGSGGGIADNEEEFVEIIQNGLRLSRVGQVLVEKSIAGWKEIEYEVMQNYGASGTLYLLMSEKVQQRYCLQYEHQPGQGSPYYIR